VRVQAVAHGNGERVTKVGTCEYEIVVRELAQQNLANRKIRE